MDYKKFSENAKLFGVPATEKHYEDAEAFIERFNNELSEAAEAYLESTLSKGIPAVVVEAVSKVYDSPMKSANYIEGLLTYAFMSGFLAGKGHFDAIETFKMQQLVGSGDIRQA